MDTSQLLQRAEETLHHLCVEIGERPVGSAGNRAATDFFAQRIARLSFDVERSKFQCMDWHDGGARLTVDGRLFPITAAPYSLGTTVTAPLVAAQTVDDLAQLPMQDRVLLLHGAIAAEPLMPKNFPFYNPQEHQRIIALLEAGRPAAIIGATACNPEMAGGVYPFPLIEDGDFDIPALTMTDEQGRQLLEYVGQPVAVESHGQRAPSWGENIIARKGGNGPRLLLCAHIDAKKGTPGAIDNGGGVVTLLLLAELLAFHQGAPAIEIVAFNGEDYYDAPGQKLYLAQHADELQQIALVINLDGVGYREGHTAYSLYGFSERQAAQMRQLFAAVTGLIEGPSWFQGDHAIFVQQGLAALALTSEQVWTLTSTITHTDKDTIALVDAGKLVETAVALYHLCGRLKEAPAGWELH